MVRILATTLVVSSGLVMSACRSVIPPEEEVLTYEVAPYTAECVGEAVQECLVVRKEGEQDWTYFYSQIEGFSYEEGYWYRILVSRRHVPDPPADGSSFEYELVEVLEREARPEGRER